jgi:hypothetical protein
MLVGIQVAAIKENFAQWKKVQALPLNFLVCNVTSCILLQLVQLSSFLVKPGDMSLGMP